MSGKNYSEKFYINDSETVYLNNLHVLGNDWRFYNRMFDYKFNSYGYRMNKELNEVNFDNYLAFFGCSNTVGIGLPLEDTFAYKISSELKIDYVNCSISGASPEFVYYNLATFLDDVPKLPKAIIIYWPDPARTCYWEKNVLSFYLPNNLPENDFWYESYKTYLMEESHLVNKFKMNLKTVRQLCKANNVKLFDFTASYLVNSFCNKYDITMRAIETDPGQISCISQIDWINLKYARDVILDENRLPEIFPKLGHPGIYHQDKITNEFLKFIG